MAGKGDKRRPMQVDTQTYVKNWDRIFAKPMPNHCVICDKPTMNEDGMCDKCKEDKDAEQE